MSIDGADGATAVTAAKDVTAVMGTRDDERDREPGSTGVIVLVAALLGFFMLSLDSTAVNVALPGIERDLGGSTAGLQWVIDAYTLMFAALLVWRHDGPGSARSACSPSAWRPSSPRRPRAGWPRRSGS